MVSPCDCHQHLEPYDVSSAHWLLHDPARGQSGLLYELPGCFQQYVCESIEGVPVPIHDQQLQCHDIELGVYCR